MTTSTAEHLGAGAPAAAEKPHETITAAAAAEIAAIPPEQIWGVGPNGTVYGDALTTALRACSSHLQRAYPTAPPEAVAKKTFDAMVSGVATSVAIAARAGTLWSSEPDESDAARNARNAVIGLPFDPATAERLVQHFAAHHVAPAFAAGDSAAGNLAEALAMLATVYFDPRTGTSIPRALQTVKITALRGALEENGVPADVMTRAFAPLNVEVITPTQSPYGGMARQTAKGVAAAVAVGGVGIALNPSEARAAAPAEPSPHAARTLLGLAQTAQGRPVIFPATQPAITPAGFNGPGIEAIPAYPAQPRGFDATSVNISAAPPPAPVSSENTSPEDWRSQSAQKAEDTSSNAPTESLASSNLALDQAVTALLERNKNTPPEVKTVLEDALENPVSIKHWFEADTLNAIALLSGRTGGIDGRLITAETNAVVKTYGQDKYLWNKPGQRWQGLTGEQTSLLAQLMAISNLSSLTPEQIAKRIAELPPDVIEAPPALKLPEKPGDGETEEAKTLNEAIDQALDKLMQKDEVHWKNRAYLMRAMLERGYTLVQSSGVIGNTWVEAAGSQLDPTITQQPNGPGRGIFQHGSFEPKYDRFGFGDPPARGTLRWYAAQNNLKWDTIEAQVGFFFWEMDHTYEHAQTSLRKIKGSATDAAEDFMNQYEKPAKRIVGKRGTHAEETFKDIYDLLPEKYQHQLIPPQKPQPKPVKPAGDGGCAPGTEYLGKSKAYPGHIPAINLCALIGVPSSGDESRPGSSYYVKGANGRAIVAAEVSQFFADLFQQARDEGFYTGQVMGSSYRTPEHQAVLAGENPDRTKVGSKFGSPHVKGLAIDDGDLGANTKLCVNDTAGNCTAPKSPLWRGFDKLFRARTGQSYEGKLGFYAVEAWHIDSVAWHWAKGRGYNSSADPKVIKQSAAPNRPVTEQAAEHAAGKSADRYTSKSAKQSTTKPGPNPADSPKPTPLSDLTVTPTGAAPPPPGNQSTPSAAAGKPVNPAPLDNPNVFERVGAAAADAADKIFN